MRPRKSAEYSRRLNKILILRNNGVSMQKLKHNQQGLIPLLISILTVVGAIIVLAFLKVLHAQS